MTDLPARPPIDPLEKIEQLALLHEPIARDEEAHAMAIDLEQARLVAVAALGALAIAWSAALGMDLKPCLFPLKAASRLLAISAALGFLGMSLCGATRYLRSAWRWEHLEVLQSPWRGAPINSKKADRTFRQATAYRAAVHAVIGVGGALGWLALPVLLIAVEQTLSQSCSASIWPPIDAWVEWPFG